MNGGKQRRNPAIGIVLIALGRRSGFAQFGNDRDAFLGSLAPVLGFAIVLTVLAMARGAYRVGAEFFCAMLIFLLTPPVIADVFCRIWKRREGWFRFSTILTWSGTLGIALSGVLVILLRLFLSQNEAPTAAEALSITFFVYGAWFTWFVARHALDLSRLRSAAVALSIVVGSTLLVSAPFSVTGSPPASTSVHGSKG